MHGKTAQNCTEKLHRKTATVDKNFGVNPSFSSDKPKE